MLSSLAVVAVGLLPTVIGGPIFAFVLIALGIAGYREYLELAARASPVDVGSCAAIGSIVVVAFGLAALFGRSEILLFAASAIAIVAPMMVFTRYSAGDGAFLGWSLVSAGGPYLGLPIYSAVALRSMPGDVDVAWLTDLASRFSLGWDASPRGLIWTVIVVVSTWVGDSAAYVTGQAVGQRQLAPRVSPNKTVEGALGGLAGSAAVGAIAFLLFDLGDAWLGFVAGGVIGIAGQLGDLGESFLKRQAGVKDSGSLIPGHGGVLDRIDALLFAFPAGLLIAASYYRLQT